MGPPKPGSSRCLRPKISPAKCPCPNNNPTRDYQYASRACSRVGPSAIGRLPPTNTCPSILLLAEIIGSLLHRLQWSRLPFFVAVLCHAARTKCWRQEQGAGGGGSRRRQDLVLNQSLLSPITRRALAEAPSALAREEYLGVKVHSVLVLGQLAAPSGSSES